jgi:uncharacterized protein
MIIDCHCHIFTQQVIQNVVSRTALVNELDLDAAAEHRSDAHFLSESAEKNNIEYCILFPTASPNNVQAENDRHISITSSFPRLRTLATLHPHMNDLAGEIERMFELGITGFKFCSFSQRFDILSEEVGKMLMVLENSGVMKKIAFTVVFDTFNRADVHFGAQVEHITTPAKLNTIVIRYPAIRFMAAHMGGLAADFNHIKYDLKPAPNLYLDTSNAAHVLYADQFMDLLQSHGANHVLFGTDWPWFDHASEILWIDSLLNKAGFNQIQKEAVFRKNAENIFSIQRTCLL